MPVSLFNSKEYAPNRQRNLLVLIAGIIAVNIIGASIWIAFPKSYGVFPLDDAYIHLVYISNLVQTGTFAFNVGELSTGTSSPLWVVINAGLVVLGVSPYWTTLYLSLLMFLCTLVLTTLVARLIGHSLNFGEPLSSLLALLASLLIAINGNIMWLALSGMETMMFIVLGLLTLLSYSYYRYKIITGILCGLLLLTHPSGIALIASLIVISLLRSERRDLIKGLTITVLVILPYLLFSFLVNGDILPTTGRGKVLTYVDSGFDILAIIYFLKAFLAYQSFLPQNYVLLVAIVASFLLFLWVRLQGKSIHDLYILFWAKIKLILKQQILGEQIGRSVSQFMKASPLTNQYLLITLLVSWGLAHLLMYALSFRILLHHTRYLANEYIILTILGVIAIGYIHRTFIRLPISVALIPIAVMAAAITCVNWSHLYHNNIRQISDEYIRMAYWASGNTPRTASIAAFDIGIMKYISGRHIVDLGGIIAKDTHECLERRSCGQFLFNSGADYIMYSRNPDVDVYNGIYKAVYEGPMLVAQRPLVHYSYPQYTAPTLTHSHRLDMYAITGWYPKTNTGVLEAFKYDNASFQPVGETIDNTLEFVGYLIDYRQIEKIPYHPLFLNFTFYFRALEKLSHPYWVHMQILSEDLETVYLYSRHIPTHNLISAEDWPVGEVIKDHHIRGMPETLPTGVYAIRLTVSQDKDLDNEKLEAYNWISLGRIANYDNRIDPISVGVPD